ncbi:MAG: hypothetical protein ABIE23_03905 [archaeon]|nr:hypothetical protein [Candidatus Micrarchaeota archaeon]
MNHKLIYALLLVVLVIWISGCIEEMEEIEGQDKEIAGEVGEEDWTEIKKDEWREAEQTDYDRYIECTKKSLAVERDTCIYDLALELMEETACNRVESGLMGKNLTDTIEYCKRQVKLKKAIELNSLEECRKLDFGFDSDNCVKEIALRRNDSGVCNEISDSAINVNCLNGIAIKQKNIEICNEITLENARGGCYTNVAVSSFDESICDIYENITVKDNCILSVAQAKKDSSVCEKIFSELTKNHCLKTTQ